MAKKKLLHAPFPMAGLNRNGSYRQQAPYSSSDMLNVHPTSALGGRERGGSRPGLTFSHRDDIGSNVRMLHPMTLALGDSFTSFSDTFGGLSLASAWTQATWASDVPSILPEDLAAVDDSISEGEVTLSTLPIDTSSNYEVEILLAPWAGAWHGAYRLYLRMDAIPDYTDEGVFIELIQTGTTGAYTASLKSYTGGVMSSIDTDSGTISSVFPGWLTATVAADVVTVWWNGTQILTGSVDSHAGTGVGFGMDCTVDGGLCLANVFRVQYYSTGTVESLRTQLIASADGDLFRETLYGRLTPIAATDLSIRDDVPISSAQNAQDLYIADFGDLRDTGTDGTMSGALLDDSGGQDWTTLGIDTDSDVCVLSAVGGGTAAGTYEITVVHATNGITLSPDPGDGTCSYRIERGPKIYTPLTDTITLQIATTGQVPTGCPLITRYLGRIMFGGAEIAPHVWYASRQYDPLDFDYAQTDSQRAVAGTSSDAGVPGDPLTALFSFSDDYCIMGCMTSIWRLAGDPAYGGHLDNLSQKVGIIDRDAWCVGPGGELVFLSLGGLYAVQPGGNSYPIPLSEQILPQEFKNIDPKVSTIILEYDVADRGIHIFITENQSNSRVHWWFDWDSKTFWPVTLQSDHEPTAVCSMQATAIEESGVILGGRDGYLRRFSGLAGNDCGTAFSSYVMIGPIPLAQDDYIGTVIGVDATMATSSGDVTWSLRPSNTFQGTLSASSSDSGTWEAGLNAREIPACRGQATILKLTGSSGERWAFENVVINVIASGMRLIDNAN